MSHTSYAIRTGVARGWAEFGHSVRNPQDITFYLVTGLGSLLYLFANRSKEVEGTSLSFPTVAMPSILAGLIVFGGVLGPAFAIAAEREDGTLLRAKATPNGMTGYVVGQVVFQAAGVVPMLAVLLIPGALLFDGLMQSGGGGWLQVTGLLLLGLAATMPIGIIIGSLASTPAKVSTWGMLPVLALAAISGIFAPITSLAGWLQGVAQAFPMYWLALGMRSAFLPDEAAAIEIGQSWRTVETVAVLTAWAVVGLLLVPTILRRMARRESGSLVEARRQERMQRVG